MNTKFEEFKELTNYDMIDTYYDDIKDFKYFISSLQEDRVESQKYIVRANKEIERLNNIIDEAREKSIKLQEKYGYILDDLTYLLMQNKNL